MLALALALSLPHQGQQHASARQTEQHHESQLNPRVSGFYLFSHATSIAQPCDGMGVVDRFVSCKVFQSDREATNFSAHAAWSLAIPLAGKAIGGKRGLYVAGAGWLGFTLVNEFLLHGPEDGRERALNLLSRIVPCAAVMLLEAL